MTNPSAEGRFIRRKRRAPLPPRGITEDEYRLWWIERVRTTCVVGVNGCWIWPGCTTVGGYGETTYRSENVTISRQMYQAFHNVVLARLEYVCHTCDVKRCCNPAHLWLGDSRLNKTDEVAKGKHYWANRTHCPKGHEYTEENTYRHEVRPGVISRMCRECGRIRSRRRYRSKQLQVTA